MELKSSINMFNYFYNNKKYVRKTLVKQMMEYLRRLQRRFMKAFTNSLKHIGKKEK